MAKGQKKCQGCNGTGEVFIHGKPVKHAPCNGTGRVNQ